MLKLICVVKKTGNIRSGGRILKNIKRILAAVAIGIFVMSSVGCNMIAKTPEAIKKAAVAKVDGETITKAQLDERMNITKGQFDSQYGTDWEKNAQYKASFDQQKTQTRDNMVNEVLILQQAKKKNLIPKDADINTEFDTEYKSAVTQAGDETKLLATLKTYYFTKETYTTYLKNQIKISKAVDSLLKDVTVEDAKVQAEYDTNKDIKYTTKPSYMHIKHILVATEDEAKKVVERLNKNEDFDKVAKEVSTDTGTKDNGGDLGDYYDDATKNTSQLDATFLAAATKVEVGKISAPVKTTYGWHVIKVTKREKFPASKFEDVKASIKETLLNAKKNTTLTDDLKKWKTDLGKKLVTYDKNM